jgi:hypothetical protein
MNSRTEIQAADLYVMMQRELRRRQSPECTSCFMQLPFRVDRADADSPNWEMVVPPSCPHGCRAVLEELVLEFGSRYDLKTASDPSVTT